MYLRSFVTRERVFVHENVLRPRLYAAGAARSGLVHCGVRATRRALNGNLPDAPHSRNAFSRSSSVGFRFTRHTDTEHKMPETAGHLEREKE